MKMSTQVSASMVKELREKSGAPMMECKKALSAEGVNGDIKAAMDWLRAKGIARAASNADRVTMEGLIAVNRAANGVVTLVEVNSETGTIHIVSNSLNTIHFILHIYSFIRFRESQQGFPPVRFPRVDHHL